MKRIVGIMIFGVCAIIFISSYIFADCGMMGHSQMKCMCAKGEGKMDLEQKVFIKIHFVLENSTDIGLTDDQIEQLKTLKYTTKKNLIKDNADIELLELDIRQALGKDEIDTKDINSLIDKKFSIKAQKAKNLVGSYASFKKILTEDQQKKMKDMFSSKMKEKKCQMMEQKKERKNFDYKHKQH